MVRNSVHCVFWDGIHCSSVFKTPTPPVCHHHHSHHCPHIRLHPLKTQTLQQVDTGALHNYGGYWETWLSLLVQSTCINLEGRLSVLLLCTCVVYVEDSGFVYPCWPLRWAMLSWSLIWKCPKSSEGICEAWTGWWYKDGKVTALLLSSFAYSNNPLSVTLATKIRAQHLFYLLMTDIPTQYVFHTWVGFKAPALNYPHWFLHT